MENWAARMGFNVSQLLNEKNWEKYCKNKLDDDFGRTTMLKTLQIM